MPVGTQGTVKGLTVDQLPATGAQMILGNTYHLALRPGAEVVAGAGRPARSCRLAGPDPDRQRRLSAFQPGRKHADRRSRGPSSARTSTAIRFELTPEKAVAIQEQLGSDVAMVLDHVVALPNEPASGPRRDGANASAGPSDRAEPERGADQALFAIVQGGLDPDLRVDCAERLAALDFPGYAVGGLSVGEEPAEMYRVLDFTVPALPADRPRYLMGVGRPQDLLEAIRPRDRPVRLRVADAQRPQCAGLYRRAARSGCGTCSISSTSGRWRPIAPAWPAATAEATCGTCSWPARCWDRSWSRCTT